MPIDKTAIGSRIKELRKREKLSQDTFVEPLGINRVSLSQVENGVIAPSLELVYNIVHSYQVTYDWLIDGTESVGKVYKTQEEPPVQLVADDGGEVHIKVNKELRDFLMDMNKRLKKLENKE